MTGAKRVDEIKLDDTSRLESSKNLPMWEESRDIIRAKTNRKVIVGWQGIALIKGANFLTFVHELLISEDSKNLN